MTIQDKWLLPEGVDELLPERAAVAESMRRSILDLFKSWGYQLVMPPLIEFTDSLLIGLGEDIAMQSFRLTDQVSGKPMAVRADITSQVARIDVHSMQAKGVNRLCYAGSVLHALPKALAASRCPILAGAELYGDADIVADIEIVSLMLETLQTVEREYSVAQKNGSKAMQRLTLDLGHVAIYQAIVAALKAKAPSISRDALADLFDAVQRKSVPDLALLVPAHIKDKALADIFYALPTLCGNIEVLKTARAIFAPLGKVVTAALDQMYTIADTITQRFPEVALYLDLGELRGYEYHTGLVFAAYADGFGSALANGGRYDEVGKVFGRARAATGFNTDVKALINYLLPDGNSLESQQTAVIAAPHHNDVELWNAIAELRKQAEVVVSVSDAGFAQYKRRLVKSQNGWVVEEA